MTQARTHSAVLLVLALIVSGCQTPRPVQNTVYVFGASWCAACHPTRIAAMELAAAGYPIRYIDCGAYPDYAKRYGISVLPTVYDIGTGTKYERPMTRTQLANLCRGRG